MSWGVGGHVVRGGAQNFKIDACRYLCVAKVIWDVVELDLSFQMRIQSSSNSSGVLRSGDVFDFGRCTGFWSSKMCCPEITPL